MVEEEGRKEGEGKRERATSSHGLCFALAAANAKEGAKEEAEPLQSRPPATDEPTEPREGMVVKPVSLARQMDGWMDGWTDGWGGFIPDTQTDCLTD